jgi:polar amino acid transport system ATP-binding protein
MIEIRGLKKSFGATPVLRGVDLHVDDGEVLALVGRSGCGKTTLLRCINFLEDYGAGEILLDGQPLWYRAGPDGGRRRVPDQEARRMRQQMGIVFQQYNLFPHMTALENVCLGPRYTQQVPAAEAEERGRRLLNRVGLADKVDAYPAQLSGGQQQRVAIARALAMRPKVLLLDEITSALDPELVGEVEDVIRSLLAERIMMILVTHAVGFAREIAHRIAYVSDGLIAEIGTPAQILEQPRDPTLKDFLRRIREPARCGRRLAPPALSPKGGEGNGKGRGTRPSGQRGDDFPVLGLGVGPEGLRANIPSRRSRDRELGGGLIIGKLGDHDRVVLTHDQVERLELASHLAERLLGRLEPGRAVLHLLDSLLGVPEQSDVGRHDTPPRP